MLINQFAGLARSLNAPVAMLVPMDQLASLVVQTLVFTAIGLVLFGSQGGSAAALGRPESKA